MCILFLAVSCLTPISKTPRNHDNQRRQMPSKCQKNFSSRSCVRPPGACRVIIAFQGLGFLSIATTTTSIRRSRTRERNLQYNILVVKFEKIFQEKGPQTQSKTKQKLSSAASFSAGIILTNGSLTTQHAHCKGKLKSHRPYQMSSLTTEKKTLRNEKPSAVVVNQTSIHNTRIRNLAARGEQIRWRGKKRETRPPSSMLVKRQNLPRMNNFIWLLGRMMYTVAIWKKVLPDRITQLIKDNKRERKSKLVVMGAVYTCRIEGHLNAPLPTARPSFQLSSSLQFLFSTKKEKRFLDGTCRQIPISRHIYKVW